MALYCGPFGFVIGSVNFSTGLQCAVGAPPDFEWRRFLDHSPSLGESVKAIAD
jgi:hypothetical protein